MTTKLTREQQKELARLLYVREDKTMQEIACEVGTARQTISRWIKEGRWDDLRVSITRTNEEQIKAMYAQLDELQRAIATRPVGQRFGTTKEIDFIKKLTSSIRDLQTDLSVQDDISVCSSILAFLRSTSIEEAQRIAPILDAYIKSRL